MLWAMHLEQAYFDEPVCIGVSGGADSVALLLRCVEAGLRVTAIHFNHGFEDELGDEDEVYVRALCAEHGIALIVGRCEEVWPSSESKEVFARRQRFDFFAKALKTTGCRFLFLAHHANDRAENLVLRLARGCGAEGLTSFRERVPFPGDEGLILVRPLLNETHAEQVAWLESRGISWREDVSNADTSIPRNAIRHLLAPKLPHFTAGANATAELLTEEHDFLHQLTLQRCLVCTTYGLMVREGTERVLLRRALRLWSPTPLSRKQTDALLSLGVGDVLEVARGVRIRRIGTWQWERLRVAPEAPPAPMMIEAPGRYTFGSWVITVSTQGEGLRLPLPLKVRGRQAGDKLRPAGFKGSKKIQDLLTELRIPVYDRVDYPLFFDPSDTLLAVPGYRTATLPEAGVRYVVTLSRETASNVVSGACTEGLFEV